MAYTRWRLLAIDTGLTADLSINALYLYDGASRIDGQAIISASHAPKDGDVQSIAQDLPGLACVFDASAVASPGFYIEWIFSGPVSVTAMRVAGIGFLSECTLMCQGADSRWVVAKIFAGIELMPDALTAALVLYSRDALVGAAQCLPGDVAQDAVTGVSWQLPAGATVQAAVTRGGVPMLLVAEDASVQYPPASPAFTNWTGASITVESIVFCVRPPLGVADGMPLMFFNGEAAPGEIYWGFGARLDGSLVFYYWSGAQNWFGTAPGVVSFETLQHWAVSISSNTIRFFVNGKQVGSGTKSNVPVPSGNSRPVRVGAGQRIGGISSGRFFVSDVIFTPGAKYVQDFSLPEFRATSRRIHTSDSRGLVTAAAPLSEFSLRDISVSVARDVEFGGAGRIFGTTKAKASPNNLPTKARVVLLHQRSKLLVRETWSDPDTGDYSFDGLDLRQEFLALAEDAAGNFRAVAAQRLLPGGAP